MAAANSTPIQLYYSNTPGSAPTTSNLIIGEVAINVPDGIIYYKDSTNNVNVIARTAAAAGRFPNVTFLADGTTQFTAAMPWATSNAIWNQANTSTQNISVIQNVNLTQNSSIIASGSYANAAYDKANTVGSYANSAFAKANTGINDASGASNYANAAFLKANTNATNIEIIRGVDVTQNTNIDYATTLAQQAYDFANTLSGGTASDGVARSVAQGAFDKANTAYNLANNDASNIAILQGVDLSQNTDIVAASSYANSAFDKANNATDVAQGAFDKANTATNNADGASNYANSAFAKANTATNNIAIIQAVNLSQNSDIIAASSYANSAFTSANNANQIAQGAFDKANNAYIAGGQIAGAYANAAFAQANTNATDIANIQGVNLTQNSSIIAAGSYANAAYTAANSSGVYANASFGQANAAFTAANSAGSYANSAYTKANAAVANTSTITVAGNLNVPGQANVNQRLSVGTGSYQVLPNLIAQFTGFSNYYSQINQQNLSANGTGDVVITADNGTDAANYMDMGMAGSKYDNTTPNAFGFVNPNDAYLMMVGDAGSQIGGNLYIGTSGSANYADISFRQGNDNTESARLVNGQGLAIKTGTVSTDTTTGALIVDGGVGVSGTINANEVKDASGDLRVLGQSAFNQANGAFTTANTKLDVTGGTVGYANVTANVSVGTYLDVLGHSSNPTVSEGRIWYNDSEHTLRQGTETGSIIELGRQITIRVKNESGVTIPKGAAVRSVGGEPSETPKIALAKANSYPWIDGLIGATNESIANNTYGYVVTSGPVTGIDTTLVNAGQIVYVSPTTAGGYTQTDVSPTDGYAVHLGTCLISDATNGAILVSLKGIEWGANFTNGAVAYSNGYRLYEDASNFFWDQSNKRLGILTNTPTANLHVQGTAYISGDVTISGNLTAANITSVSTQELTVSGNTIYLNDGSSGAPVYNASIMVVRGTSPNTYLRWNEQVDEWVIFDGTDEGHVLDSSKTFQTWGAYSAGVTYEKAAYPIGGDLANATNELAKSASTTATAGLSTAVSGSQYANAAFAKANTVDSQLSANVYYFQGVEDTQNTSITSALNIAQGAFDKANTGGVRTVTVANSNRLTQNTGSGDVRLDLATTTVVAGTYTYPYLNVDAYGRITSIHNQTPVTTITYAGSTYSGDVTLSTTDIVNILGYTPVDNSVYFVDQGQLAGVNIKQNTNTVLVGAYANAAFGKANAAMIQANNAWTTANGISDAALSAGVYANAALELATTVSYYANAPLELVTAAGAYANAAFGKANSAFAAGNVHASYANAAFTKANTAFTNADVASSYANSAFELANTTTSGMIAAGAYANAAFVAANNALIAGGQVSGAYANAAFGTANAAFIRANTAFNNADGASNYANAAFVLANTTTSGMVAAGAYANAAFVLANTTTSGMIAAGAYANAAYAKANTAFNNAGGASNYANAAFVVANSAFTGMIDAGGYANTAFDKANSAYDSAVIGIANASGASNYANGAFLKANTAFNNADGASNYANAAFALANTVSYYANTSRSSLINGSYTLSLDSQGVLNVPVSQYNTAQVFAPINYDLYVGTSSKFWQFKGDGSALVFPDNTRQTTAYPVTAYSTANTASAYANAAFTKANTALANTSGTTFGGDLHIAGNVDVMSVTFPDGTRQYTSPDAISSYANSAYNKANSAGIYANTALTYATSAGGYANAAFIKANTAWSYLQNGANTVTLDSIGQLILPQVSQGGVTSGFLTSAGKFTFNAYGNLWVLDEYGNFTSPYNVKITPGGIQWADGSTQNTAAASLAYTQQAFGGANAASSYANSAFGVANTGLSTATSAGSYANSAYVKANTAWTLANDAYAFANTLANGIAQDTGARNIAQGAFDKANSAFDVGQGAFDTANTNSGLIGVLQGIENYQNTYIQLVESAALAASAYANAAFDAANVATGGVAGVYANAAFAVANTASAIAQGAFDKANTDQYGVIAAGSYANSAFAKANTGVSMAQLAWNKANTSASFLYTVSSTPPAGPGPSDLWYDTSSDILYQYITSDGTHYYWIDIDSPTVSSANTTISYTYTGYGRSAAMAMVFGGF